MEAKNYVFIAQSLDGYIADRHGGIDWLHTTVPNPEQKDMGYEEFIQKIDAIVMGRKTFETVLGFDIEWPYSVPVFVLSTTLKSIPKDLSDKVKLVKGELSEVLDTIRASGYSRLYIDGGKTIQSFLREDLVDEIILSTLPILLGGGFRLFGNLTEPLKFEHVDSRVLLDAITQDRYRRERN